MNTQCKCLKPKPFIYGRFSTPCYLCAVCGLNLTEQMENRFRQNNMCQTLVKFIQYDKYVEFGHRILNLLKKKFGDDLNFNSYNEDGWEVIYFIYDRTSLRNLDSVSFCHWVTSMRNYIDGIADCMGIFSKVDYYSQLHFIENFFSVNQLPKDE